MRASGTQLYKRVFPSIGPLVRPSVHLFVTPVQKPCFSAVFGHGEILLWNKSIILRVSFTTWLFHPSFCPSVSPYKSHDQYMQRHSPYASLPGWACYNDFSLHFLIYRRPRILPSSFFFTWECFISYWVFDNPQMMIYKNWMFWEKSLQYFLWDTFRVITLAIIFTRH